MLILYNLLLVFLAPLWVPWMLIRANRRNEMPIWSERFGNYTFTGDKKKKRVWLHAVSVGEVIAAKPIVTSLRKRIPDAQILLTVTTSSGRQTALDQVADLVDHIAYFPIDVARFQVAALSRFRPHVVAIMETELWFNFLWAARALGSKTLLLNGRISDRSFPRSMRIRFFYRALLRLLDRALMQTERDRERILALGAEHAETMGNCKFDQASSDAGADGQTVRAELGAPDEARIVVIGSTRGEMEEDFVLSALRSLDRQNLVVVHAPRHLERVPELVEKVKAAGWPPSLRSKGETGAYLILDTYGELTRIYAAADVVVIGGGFDRLGGQNLIQPLAAGKPVIHGQHMENFADATIAADQVGAAVAVASPEELAEVLRSWLDDPADRARRGAAAREWIGQSLGASDRYAQAIVEALG